MTNEDNFQTQNKFKTFSEKYNNTYYWQVCTKGTLEKN